MVQEGCTQGASSGSHIPGYSRPGSDIPGYSRPGSDYTRIIASLARIYPELAMFYPELAMFDRVLPGISHV